MSAAKTTIDHEEIRRWVEARDGSPARVAGTEAGSEESGVLRVDFPGYSGHGRLIPISWDEWFKIFEERNLAFLHQDKTAHGEISRFNKLVSRETVARREHGEHHASSHDH